MALALRLAGWSGENTAHDPAHTAPLPSGGVIMLRRLGGYVRDWWIVAAIVAFAIVSCMLGVLASGSN